MLGHPMYKKNDYVIFKFKDDIKGGRIHIIDAYGTFDQQEEASYDIYVAEDDCLYKHIPESYVEDLIPYALDMIPSDQLDIGKEVIFGSFVTSSMKKGSKPTSLEKDVPLRWQIVAETEDTLTILGSWCVDWDFMGTLNWESSNVRSYINGELMDWMFNETEKEMILPTEIITRSFIDGHWREEVTKDHLYIPDFIEMMSFINEPGVETGFQEFLWEINDDVLYGDWSKKLKMTMPMCEDDTNDRATIERCSWWLRNFNDDSAVLVDESGQVWLKDMSPDMDEIGIRLMLRVKVKD